MDDDQPRDPWRPPRSEDGRTSTHRITVRYTDVEHATLKLEAARAKLSLSELIRRRSLREK